VSAEGDKEEGGKNETDNDERAEITASRPDEHEREAKQTATSVRCWRPAAESGAKSGGRRASIWSTHKPGNMHKPNDMHKPNSNYDNDNNNNNN